MVWPESVLTRREEMVGGEILVELPVNRALDYFGDDRDQGNWTVV